MKKINSILAVAAATLLLCGCDDNKSNGDNNSNNNPDTNIPQQDLNSYEVEKADFYYSYDNGASYGNERYELEVGDIVLMKVLVTVTTKKDFKETITGTLSIPNINSLDSYYIRGQKITPTIDKINNITNYPFEITTNEDWQFVFKFVPLEVGMAQMSLDFDAPIPDIYDSVNTIEFVNKKEENKPEESTPSEDNTDNKDTTK